MIETKPCVNCNKVMEKKPSFSASYWDERKLCGRECQSQWMKGKHNSPDTEFSFSVRLDVKCTECSTMFKAFAPNAKYCSNRCYKKVKQRNVKLRENYKINSRRDSLKRKFNLTLEDYDLMLQNQNFRCAICSVHHSELSRRMAVDHDHDTGKIRGLLCIECNRGIGALKDSMELLEKAYKYLERNSL